MSFRTISAYLCNRFNTQNKANMKQKADHTSIDRQRRNMQFAEERIELLDTIREMIDIELEQRGVDTKGNTEGNPHPENPPPYYTRGQPSGRELSEDKPSRPSLWQRIVGIFTGSLPDNEDM